ncbi:MAG TPA: phenylalanine--tRNA ligase beta subunit-related protein [Vicinamibacterales bacterium]|nr:phenylalanine--tRNA ligase beta subunit-related protein [Vicinamibacterales bacterium]
MTITVVPPLDHIITLAVLGLDDLHVRERDEVLDEPLAEAAARLRGTADVEPHMAATRSMYRKVGIDPTKTRPSSEALLRRIKKGEGLPRINTLVDICNWCSAEFQLPYGLYDRERILGNVQFRLGDDGEEYRGIRKDTVHVAGRPTLADSSGAFGNPTSDSARTMVTPSTTQALVVVFVPREVPRTAIERVIDATAERALRFAHGAEVFRQIVPSA